MIRIGKSSREKGEKGENLVEKYLKSRGYRVICRNYVGKHGEIDIISEKESKIVFTEVKLRKEGETQAKAVNSEKRKRIRAAADEFLAEYAGTGYISDLNIRFDVASVSPFDEKNKIKYIENAF
ncbi:MAG: YraN family protein [Clostridia bacterium]|nr:YraN family protein [Clostridia bacterium]